MKQLLNFCLWATLAGLTAGPSARAAELPRRQAHFTEKSVTFVRHPLEHLTVSEDCEGKKGARCQARLCLPKLSRKKILLVEPRPESEGSALCEIQAQGTVVVATDDARNENSYCRFSDGSLIDHGSLEWRARLNDKRP